MVNVIIYKKLALSWAN